MKSNQAKGKIVYAAMSADLIHHGHINIINTAIENIVGVDRVVSQKTLF